MCQRQQTMQLVRRLRLEVRREGLKLGQLSSFMQINVWRVHGKRVVSAIWMHAAVVALLASNCDTSNSAIVPL